MEEVRECVGTKRVRDREKKGGGAYCVYIYR